MVTYLLGDSYDLGSPRYRRGQADMIGSRLMAATAPPGRASILYDVGGF